MNKKRAYIKPSLLHPKMEQPAPYIQRHQFVECQSVNVQSKIQKFEPVPSGFRPGSPARNMGRSVSVSTSPDFARIRSIVATTPAPTDDKEQFYSYLTEFIKQIQTQTEMLDQILSKICKLPKRRRPITKCLKCKRQMQSKGISSERQGYYSSRFKHHRLSTVHVIQSITKPLEERLKDVTATFSAQMQSLYEWLNQNVIDGQRQHAQLLQHILDMKKDITALKVDSQMAVSERSPSTRADTEMQLQYTEEEATSNRQKGTCADKQQSFSSGFTIGWPSFSMFPNRSSNNQLKLKEENDRLRQLVEYYKEELQRQQAEYDSKIKLLEKQLAEAMEASKRSTKALMTFKNQTEGEWTGSKTPSTVSQNFGKLFSTTLRRCIIRGKKDQALIDISSSDREVANDIFKAAYDECQIEVLKELFKELFRHYEPGDDTTIADTQKRVYGKLLSLKKEQLQDSIDQEHLTHQVLDKLHKKFDESESEALKCDSTYLFAKEAVKSALEMIAMQPPMVVDYPKQLACDDRQEKQYGQWDSELQEGKYALRYFRPVLYASYRDQECLQRAYVGNKHVNS